MMRRRLWLLSWLVTPSLIAGCAGSPASRIYVLGDPTIGPPSVVAPVAVAQSGWPVIRLVPVSVPDYLDTRDILLRSGPNEVKASPTGRWAERLSVGVTRALAAALTADLPGADIVTEQPAGPPVQVIVVDVQAFTITPDRQCRLTAQWTLSSGDGDRILRSERASFVEPAADASDAAIAAAMTRTIDRLATQVAAAMPLQGLQASGNGEARQAKSND